MIKSRWFYHPLFVFIFSLVALATSLFLYIRSYLRVNEALQEVVLKYNLNSKQIFQGETWVLILTLSLLVTVIIAGLLIIYIYYQKMIQLYRLQQNFINGFTHELKTPIASLQLFLETFSRHELERLEQLRYLDYMKRDTKRLSDNVNRILQLSRLEDRDVKAEFKDEDIVSIINQFIKNTPHLFDEGRVIFETDLESYFMQADFGLFEMILMNLVTNAFIYNNSREKIVRIKLEVIKNNVVLEIRDNGVGLDKHELKKVFKKFYQVGKSTKGSGLGLYIVQSIAKLHRGEISAESAGPGNGATFRIIFKGSH
ncbi:MAG: HAMP domain-containing histidine kinase [Bacteriovorax sp.]|nr:HAMP domain-containing histidine kinase [Bacteriovorax sp.]